MRKIITAIMVVMLVFAMSPVFALAAEGDTPTDVSTYAELKSALETGGSIRLTADITTNASVVIPGGITAVIDLNGFAIDRGGRDPVPQGNILNISEGADLTLTDSSAAGTGKVTGASNLGMFGGAVYMARKSSFTLEGGSITDNVVRGGSGSFGGGVFVNEDASFTMTGGEISFCSAGASNTASQGHGGGVALMGGKFTMKGGRIYKCGIVNSSNVNRSSSTAFGGAVYVGPNSTFTMDGGELGNSEERTGNQSNDYGGAVYVAPADDLGEPEAGDQPGQFDFNGGVILVGSSTHGGAVFNGGIFNMKEGAEIQDTTRGESVCNEGVYTMTGGTISSVPAASGQSGVTVDKGGVFDMSGGKITGNHNSYGGGVLVTGGKFNMTGGSITGNSAGYSGGGVYIADQSFDPSENVSGGTFKMSGGEISDNEVRGHNTYYNIPGDGNGGGVWVGDDAVFSMAGGSITGNRSCLVSSDLGDSDSYAALGGGVYIHKKGTFEVSGAVTIQNNTVGKDYVSNVKFDNLASNSPLLKISGDLTGSRIGITPDLIDDASPSSANSIESFKYKEGADDNIFSAGYEGILGSEYPGRFFTSDVDGYAVVLHSSKEAQLLKHTHKWTFKEFVWTGNESEGYTGATAEFVCEDYETHTMPVPAAMNSVTNEATCTEAGNTTFTATVVAADSPDGKEHTESKVCVQTDPLGHDWGEPTYTWDGTSSVTAERVCTRDGSHSESETVNTTAEITKQATCEEKGETTYTAAFTNTAFTAQTKTVEDVEPLGHTWEFKDFTWTGSDTEGYTAAAANFVCANDETHHQTVEAAVTEDVLEPTCTEAGNTSYTATVAAADSPDGKQHTDTKNVKLPDSDPIGHKWGEWKELDDTSHQRVCANDPAHKETEDHAWDEGKVTRQATEGENGIKTYTCSVCGATKEETIPKLSPASPAGTEKTVKTVKTVNGVLLAKMTAKGNKSIVISWNKIKGADGYDIFFSGCNKKDKKIQCKMIKSISGNTKFKLTKKGLKKGRAYKAYVKAYIIEDGKKKYVRSSLLVHAFTSGGDDKYTNAKAVKVKKAKVSLKKGKTFKIKATVTKLKAGKKLMAGGHAPKLRYVSSNTKVATVSNSGKIKATGKGTCNVYAVAVNGARKAVKVTVK